MIFSTSIHRLRRKPGKSAPALTSICADLSRQAIIEVLEHRTLFSAVTFAPQATYAAHSSPLSVVAVDVTGDGKADLIVTNELSNTVSVLISNGDGTFKPQQEFAAGNYPYSVVAADVNGDGKVDLVVANYSSNAISVLLGNGDGTFRAPQAFAAGNEPESVKLADVNGDGKLDVVVANYADNTLSVLLGNGDGTFRTQQSFAVGNGPRSVIAADLNGDGKVDLATANYADGTVSVLLGNGNGTFQAQRTIAVGNGPRSVIAVDVNGDNKLDLVTSNQSSDTVSVLLGNGNGTFQAQQTFALDYAPREVVAADINGDGNVDLVTANYSKQTVSVLLGNGNGTFKAQQTFGVGYSPISVATADLNGDGLPDIVTANAVDGTVSVLLNTTSGAVRTSPAISSANQTTFSSGAAGTFTLTTTGSPSPTLTESGALVSGLSFHDNGDGTATLSGTPAAGTGGTYLLTFTAANGVGSAATQAFTLTVDQSPAISSANHATLTAGSAGSFTITTTGFPAAALVESGSLPSGLTFTDNGNGTATLSGTPGAAQGGNYLLTLTANNGIGSPATQVFTLSINQAAAITSINHGTFIDGSAGSFIVSSSGFPAGALSETGALPAGLTFHDNGNGTATLGGTAAANGGNYVLTLAAGNGVGAAGTQLFTLTVDQSSAISSSNQTTFTSGSAGAFSVTTSGFPAAAITETGVLPGGVTFHDNGNGTATLGGTPAGGTGGTYVLTLSAGNGVGVAASQMFTLTVGQVPAITTVNQVFFTTGSSGLFTIRATGFPTPAITETGALPSGVVFTPLGNGTATLSGTPAAGTGGVYTLTLQAKNGSTNASQTFTLTVDQGAAISSAGSATFTTGSAAAFSVTTTGFPVAALTETGTLPSGVTFHDNGNGTASLSGTPGVSAGGTYLLTFSASNGVGGTATQTFTLDVNQTTAITSAAQTAFTTGVSGAFTVTTVAVPSAALIESGTLPGGVSFHDNGNGTATLSGTPGASAGGVYLLTLTASNGVGPAAIQNFSLTIDQAAAITSGNQASFTTGSAGTFAISTTGFPPAVLTQTGTLPAGVTFRDNGNGTAALAGTPGMAAGGTYVLTLSANNGVGAIATQVFTLTVNQTPAITSAAQVTFTSGSVGDFSVTSIGIPAAALTEAGALPAGITFHDNGNGTASLTGRPAAGAGGTYILTLTAANSGGTSATQVFTLTVDQATAITSANHAAFTTGSAGAFTFVSTGFPVAALSETGTLPAGVSFHDNGDGAATLSGTPSPGAGGIYNLTLSASNGVSSAAGQVFTLTVGQAPAITSTSQGTFTTGVAATFTIITTGFPTAAVTESGALPCGLSFRDNGDGTASLSGTPNAGTAGTYTLTLQAKNGGTDASQTFTLTVNDAAAITSIDHATFSTGAAGTFIITARGFPAATLTESGQLPAGIRFSDNGDGTATLHGTPAITAAGSYTLTLSATNSVGGTSSQTFTLTVVKASTITSLNHAVFIAGAASTFTVSTTGVPAAALTETGALPAGISFVDNGNGTASLAGAAAGGTGGSYTITITADNGIGGSVNQTFTLTVHEASAITTTDHATFSTAGVGTFVIATTGFPGAVLTESGRLPTGLHFKSNGNGTASLFGTPSAGTAKTYALTFTAGNGVGSKAAQSFTLTVEQPSAIISRNHATFSAGVDGTFTISTSGLPAGTLTATGTLPAGISFADNGNGTATLSGTAALGSSGSYMLTLSASNGVGSPGVQTFTLKVNQAPAITSANQATFSTVVGGTFSITTSGFPAAALTEVGALPRGVRFKSNPDGTASLFGIPALGTDKTYVLIVSAGNGVGAKATQTFTLTVDQPAAIISANHATFSAGVAGSFTVNTSGLPTGTLTEIGALPAGLTFTDNGNGTATLSGAAALGSSGSYTLTLSAANGVGSPGVQTFTLKVNQAPAITSNDLVTYTTLVGGTFTVTTTGFPAAKLAEIGALPSGVHFKDNGDGTASLFGTPATGTGKAYHLTLSAGNGVGSKALQTFTLTVLQAPVFKSPSHATFSTNAAGSFTIVTVGPPAGALTETGALPGGLTFTDNGNGTATLAGTPDAATGGAYTLTLAVDNGVGAPVTQTFTLDIHQGTAITSANQATFTAGSTGTFAVTTTGFPAAALTELGLLPAGLHLHSNGDGTATLSGTPALTAGKTYHVTLSAANGVGAKAVQAFTVIVNQAPTITSANHASFLLGRASSFAIKTLGFPSAALTESGVLPTGVTFTDNANGTATLSGTPAAGSSGTFALTLSATNGIGSPVLQTFTLSVP